ncbi:uncharacterized protein LOC111697399 [Eurytemora carolleeae]|uniref:uncharacterized protein LOC111697399 n=1 Tax=Eurytemora carolleeae TaxID=1294199 RepID=UPI000C7916E9|nr:uncharacterized protein LOC111697399 [Eurytemora carolleeae]|eukprot:XP_023323178.1 uncharacterized protein LOC111697399 [Eurytemora affinis]
MWTGSESCNICLGSESCNICLGSESCNICLGSESCNICLGSESCNICLGSESCNICLGSVLSPVISKNKSDILLLVSEPRLIHWNHTISKELDYKSEKFDIQQSLFSGNPVYVLEKTQNRVNGVVDRREGGDQDGWKTLYP